MPNVKKQMTNQEQNSKSKKRKIIIIIITLIVLGLVYFLFIKKPEQRDFIDLKNSVVDKNLENDLVAQVNIANREMVQVRFFWEVNGIKYNDALNILKSEYEKLSPADIEKMKQERFDNWVKTVNKGSKEE